MIVTSLLCTVAVRQGASPTIYFVRNDSIYRSAQGRETLLLKHAVAPALSPNDKRLAFLRDGDLYVYDLETEDTKRCSQLPEKPSDTPEHDTFPSWDASSRFVVFSHPDRYGVVRKGEEIHPMFGTEHSLKTIWNVNWCWTNKKGVKADLSLFLGNETSGPSKFSVQSSLSAAFSPEGRRVAFCRNGDLWLATLEPSAIHDAIREASWDEARILTCGIQEGGTRASNETSAIFRISWSPDGKLLALSSDRYGSEGSPEIQIVRADRPSEKIGTFPGSDACFLDAGHIVYVKPYAQSQDIWVRDLETKDEKILISHASEPAVGSR